ncbi:L-type lectin-domain containing receptor kinase IX.1-like [Prunus yedoensis var. nudiflora]|uniref:L-type lectin-domain containing receptor kinase IX.1-like n=1 Tax=Prunus yedoensis var. nudiflora TaxID=2094558 RepID=A0A314Y7X5_PRUYE|nr:L-type lectin-domain containing receptor kinase IX.1-like [Prunus yedoensis var. nudiflora]
MAAIITLHSPKFFLVLLLLTPCATLLAFHFPTFQQSDHNSSTTKLLNNKGDASFLHSAKEVLLNRTLGVCSSIGLPVNSSMENVIEPRNEYRNPWPAVEDSEGNHVGIDVDSVKSNVTRPRNAVTAEGKLNHAWISYNSSSKNLSVAFTTYVNGSQEQVINSLSYMVDLNKYLPDWIGFGFSASTGAASALHNIISWNFTSSSPVDDESLAFPGQRKKNKNLQFVRSTTDLKPSQENARNHWWFSLGLFNSCKKRAPEGRAAKNLMIPHDMIEQLEKEIRRPRQFSYKELDSATRHFSEGEKLGEGEFVKKISKPGLKEVVSEVSAISRLRHRNLIQLIGWCHDEGELVLVYEFMPNGRLDSHLFQGESRLVWEIRYRIAQGLASGLLYLHQELEQCVLHRDIKSRNVKLDSNFNAKLGGFRFARLVDQGQELEEMTTIVGTHGYMATEYLMTGKASMESDIYSFGVVALEIACGKRVFDVLESGKPNMVEWVWELYGEGKVIEAADPKLCGDFDEKQMECLLIVGLWCAHPNYNSRPSIQQVIQTLNFEVAVPIQPSKMRTTTSPLTISVSGSSSSIGSERGQVDDSGPDYTTNCLEITESSATNSPPSISLG